MAAFSKLNSGPQDIELFTTLGMEPTGRIIIGLIELMAAVFLIIPAFSAVGALLAVGVMFGAVIAHLTVIGVVVQNDGGKHFALLCVVLFTSMIVLYRRRHHLPMVGKSL
jgi:putative oxidoreductase